MDVETHIDPEVAAALAGSPIGSVDFGSLRFADLPGLRQAMASAPTPPLPPTTTVHHDQVVPGPDGQPDVTVRIYQADPDGSGLPCLYWIHGGGYMFGTALGDDARLNRWAEELHCVVVSVEYRLAPEYPYPAPLEDCYAGLVWTVKHAAEIGVDPARVIIGGASAGGGLAAGLALLVRDRHEVQVGYQLLIYPMIDDRDATVSSRIGAPVWNPDANRLGWSAYLGADLKDEDVPAYAAPARSDDLSGLPPAFVGVGTLDVFRDEDVDYALRLLQAEVATELHLYPGAPHGFDVFAPGAEVSKRFQRDMDDALRRAFAATAGPS